MTETFYLFIVVMVALAASFVILLLKKWEVLEWLQVHGSDLISRAAGCSLCMSWWTCVVMSVIVAVFIGEWLVLFVPFYATPITRLLVV